MLLPGNELLRDVYVHGLPSAPTVALTFDDGPNGRCTEQVLDALAETGVPATFFVLGKNVRRDGNAPLLARMVREGHTIGVHSDRHRVRPAFLNSLTVEDLRDARAAVLTALANEGITDPPVVNLFRPPFGFLLGTSAHAATETGFVVVEWTVSVGDWHRGLQAEDVTTAVMERVRGGDVIVLHDGDQTNQRSLERCADRTNTAPTVRLLVPALAEKGLRVAPLVEVLGLTPPPRR